MVGERSRRRNRSRPDTEGMYKDAITMDKNVWSQLPQELVFCILARLPVISFIRLRSVCKTWNALMYLSAFLEMCADVPTQERFGVLSTGFGTLKYIGKPKVLQFSTYPNPFRYRTPQRKKYRLTLSFLPSASASLVAGNGGLLCFCDLQRKRPRREGVMRWWVCNPITKKCRELPPKLNADEWPRVHILVMKDPFRYKVIVYWCVTRTWQEYDSVTDSWGIDGPLKGRSYPSFILFNASLPNFELRLASSP